MSRFSELLRPYELNVRVLRQWPWTKLMEPRRNPLLYLRYCTVLQCKYKMTDRPTFWSICDDAPVKKCPCRGPMRLCRLLCFRVAIQLRSIHICRSADVELLILHPPDFSEVYGEEVQLFGEVGVKVAAADFLDGLGMFTLSLSFIPFWSSPQCLFVNTCNKTNFSMKDFEWIHNKAIDLAVNSFFSKKGYVWKPQILHIPFLLFGYLFHI
jgi:hypothetical protein